MSRLKNNLKALEEIHPELVEALQAAPSFLDHCENTPDGFKTVRVNGDSGAWVHSRRAPKREAERIVKSFEKTNLKPCVVLGMGLGYVIKMGLAANKTNPHVVIEDNLSLVRTALELHDFSAEIAARKLVLACDVPQGMCLNIYDSLRKPFSDHGMGSIGHAYTNNDDHYSERFQQLSEWIRLRMMSMKTQMTRARLNLENLLLNMPHYLVSAGVTDMIGAMEGKPGVLVASGPSLERNIEVLREYQDKVYIHAVSSALKRLMKEGIRVDSTNVVDYSHVSQKYFTDLPQVDFRLPQLWFQGRCSHAVLDAYDGDKVACDDDLMLYMLQRQRITKGYSPIEGNNVAHYAYAALRALGCDPIIFVGLDQALSFYTSHAPGIPLHDEWSASISRFQSLESQELRFCYFIADWDTEREDQYGNPLLTDRLMEASAISFESIFARDPEANNFNCTEGGRRLKGVPDRPLREVLEEYCKEDITLDEVHSRSDKMKELHDKLIGLGLEGISDVKAQTEKLKQIIRDGKRAMKRGEKDVLKGKTPRGVEEAIENLNTGINVNRAAYVFIKTFAMADDHARKRVDRQVEDENMPAVQRMRMEINREHGYLVALERAVLKWEEVLKIGEERLSLVKEKGLQSIDEFDAQAALADLEASA